MSNFPEKIPHTIEILFTIAVAAFLTWLICHRRVGFFEAEGISRKAVALVFIAKILAGIAVWIIYTYYYTDRRTADIYKYFDDAEVIHRVLFKNPGHYFQILLGIDTQSETIAPYLKDTWNWFKPHDTQVYNDNRSIIRFNCIVRLFSFGYYHVHSVVMNFVCLCGLMALFKAFLPFFPPSTCPENSWTQGRKALFAAVFFIPSVMFWGSGVLKEGLLFFGIGFLLFHYFRMVDEGFSARRMTWIGIAIFILFICKYYIALALLPGMLAYGWARKTSEKKLFLKYAMSLVIVLCAGIFLGMFFPENDPLKMLVRKQTDFINLADSLQSGSRFEIPRTEPTVVSVMANAPQAIFHTFTKPHIFEAGNPMMWMAAIENTGLLILLALCLILVDLRYIRWNAALFCLGFTLTMYALIGLATPVIGALVRYKTPALPFLAIALLLLIDQRKMTNLLRILKR